MKQLSFNLDCLPGVFIVATLFFGLVGNGYGQTNDDQPPARSVFEIPAMKAEHTRLRLLAQQAVVAQNYSTAIRYFESAIKLFPEESTNYYLLASCQAQVGDTDAALASLELAIETGFNDVANIKSNQFLRVLRDTPGYAELIRRAPKAKIQLNPLFTKEARKSKIVNRQAWVEEANTQYSLDTGTFETFFQFVGSARLEGPPATRGNSPAAKQVQEWFFRGLGAGLKNHLYDNHDGGHSPIQIADFPQLNRIMYGPDAKLRKLDHGLQTLFLYNMVTVGNASEAMTSNIYWRSLPRLAYTSPAHANVLYQQYRRNQLYVYPEHNDHDPQHGDVFPANTPYVLISQGSSGSDKSLVEAALLTLAAFQPKTKRVLVDNGALMPTVQMIFRRTNQNVESFRDYLTGKAHPTAFDPKSIDVMRMIELANEIKPDKVPPVVQLAVTEEDTTRLGIDYFDDAPRTRLFDTPAAIARLHKTTRQQYRMVVSAKKSYDINGRPLTFHWRVLRGAPESVQIKPLNAERTLVEILLRHQRATPIGAGNELTSSRIDIGAFAHNGTYYSAPAFVTIYSPRNEVREYNSDGTIDRIEYLSFEKQYEDPLHTTPRQWTDEYEYDQTGKLVGWIRTSNGTMEQFTADGALVTKNDELGRPAESQTILYRRAIDPKTKLPQLRQILGPERRFHQYDSPEDLIGRIAKRSPAVGNPIQPKPKQPDRSIND